jgi:hypothetical protein
LREVDGRVDTMAAVRLGGTTLTSRVLEKGLGREGGRVREKERGSVTVMKASTYMYNIIL